MVRRELILKSIVMVAIVVVASTTAHADTFDWRNVGGLDYMTPVQNQNPAGTCWAFAAVGALEAKFDIGWNNPNLNLNLSEQHLVCDDDYTMWYGGWEYDLGDKDGGYEFAACSYFVDNGITDEATIPYTAQNTSPNWPLTPPNNFYGISASEIFIDNTTSNVKYYLQTYGPLVAAMNANDDWYNPSGTNGITEVPDFYKYDPTGATNHAVVIAGFVDTGDDEGYYIIKNSWGSTWGPTGDGYGYIEYGVLEGHDRIHALTGDPVFVPVPAAVLLGMLGLGVVGIKLRRYA